MSRIFRTIICSLLVIADLAMGVAAYGAVWCHEADGSVSFESASEHDAVHRHEDSNHSEATEVAFTLPTCIDVPASAERLRESTPKAELKKVQFFAASLLFLIVHGPESYGPPKSIYRPGTAPPSFALSQLSTVVLVL